MNHAEDTVVALLESIGFRCECFTETEMRRGKTPDRRVYRDSGLLFFLEVKEIVSVSLVDGACIDSRFNRLTADIHAAVKQFDAVNQDRVVPNVLAIVNSDPMSGSLDLDAVLTGNALTESGRLPIHNRQARGRIRDEKLRVDGYLWFDQSTPTKMFLNAHNSQHQPALRSFFDPIFNIPSAADLWSRRPL